MAAYRKSGRASAGGHKYIFVVGGVMSGVGKGIATASIGKLLTARGLSVNLVKIDPGPVSASSG